MWWLDRYRAVIDFAGTVVWAICHGSITLLAACLGRTRAVRPWTGIGGTAVFDIANAASELII